MSDSRFIKFLRADMEDLARNTDRIRRTIAEVKADKTRSEPMRDRLLSRLQKLLNRDTDEKGVSNRLYADLAKVAPSTVNSIMDGFFTPDPTTVGLTPSFQGAGRCCWRCMLDPISSVMRWSSCWRKLRGIPIGRPLSASRATSCPGSERLLSRSATLRTMYTNICSFSDGNVMSSVVMSVMFDDLSKLMGHFIITHLLQSFYKSICEIRKFYYTNGRR